MNKLQIAAIKLAVKFSDENDVPSRLKIKEDSSPKKTRNTDLNSLIEQRFKLNVDMWQATINKIIEFNTYNLAWRFINISPEVNIDCIDVTQCQDFLDFTDYLVIRRDIYECDSDELGCLSMLHSAFQKRIESLIKNKSAIHNPDTFDGNYIAIDFETANEKRISACAIGIAVFENFNLINSFKSFLQPPANNPFTLTRIHHIKETDVVGAPNFKTFWNKTLNIYFQKYPVVLHNASMDAAIINQLFELYDIEFNFSYYDTMHIAKLQELPGKIQELCSLFNIHFDYKHDPELDAIACGQIFSKLIHGNQYDLNQFKKSKEKPVQKFLFDDSIASKKFDKTLLTKDLSEADPKSFFYNKKVVFTGDLNKFDRSVIAEIIQKQGADINTAISKLTDYVIVGENPGPSKMQKIKELQDNGAKIQIIDEAKLLTLINS